MKWDSYRYLGLFSTASINRGAEQSRGIFLEMNQSIQFYTRDEIAKALRVSRGFLDHAALKGEGPPFYRIGRSIRYDRMQVIEWLRTTVRQPDAIS
jgi:excisionase family DNA binding protein